MIDLHWKIIVEILSEYFNTENKIKTLLLKSYILTGRQASIKIV